MNQSSLNKVVDVQGLSLALAKTKADYMHYANITGALGVNVTYNSTTDTYSVDRTYNEIVARINNRGYVYAIYNGTIFELSYFYDGNIGFTAAFSLDTDDRFMGTASFNIDSSNVIDFDEHNGSYLSSVNLNGSETTFPQFYAPTTAGTSGQVLTSSGSGAPTWSNISTPTAATATPLMDGTAAVGSSSKYAKEDHVHPSDTTKANVSDVLTKTNTTSYTPSADYHPTTKKYVDDKAPLMLSAAFHETQENRVVFTGATPKQVADAFNQGKTVYAVLEEGTLLTLTDCYIESYTYDGYYFCFTSTTAIVSYPSFCVVNVNIDVSSSSSTWHGEDTSWLGDFKRSDYVDYLEGLQDISLSTLSDGQALVYDATNYVWKNATIPTGATYTLSMTNNVITLTGSNGSTSSVTLPVYNGSVSSS